MSTPHLVRCGKLRLINFDLLPPRRVRNAHMRDLLALLVFAFVVVSACKKAEVKNPGDTEVKDSGDLSEEEMLALLEQSGECWEGGPPEGLLISIDLDGANEVENVKITPPADEETTACVVAKVKAGHSKHR